MASPRLALIGAGNMAQRAHIRNYAALAREGRCKIVGLLDARPELARRVAHSYDIAHTFGDLPEVLDNPQVDGIVAILPYDQHVVVVPKLLAKGVPVFTEKPLALSVSAGERLVAAGEKYHATHMIGYHKRCDPAVQYARQLVSTEGSENLGRMRYIRVTMPPGDWVDGSLPAITTSESMTYAEQDRPDDVRSVAAYDAFVNYYIHQVNLIRFLLGTPYTVRFADRAGTLLCGESSRGISVTLEMEPFRLSHGWWEQVLIGFEHAFIEMKLAAPLAETPGQIRFVTEQASEVREQRPVLPSVSAMRQQAMTFLDVIEGKGVPPCNAREAIEDLKIARAWFQYRDLASASG